MLHEIDEVRVYCGPAALMAITGERLPVVRSAINKAKGKRDNAGVIGTSVPALLQALDTLGYKHYCTSIKFPDHVKTLGKLVKNKYWCQPDRTYIVNITGHYVAVENGKVVDNHYRFGTDIDECKWKGKYVQSLIWVHK